MVSLNSHILVCRYRAAYNSLRQHDTSILSEDEKRMHSWSMRSIKQLNRSVSTNSYWHDLPFDQVSSCDLAERDTVRWFLLPNRKKNYSNKKYDFVLHFLFYGIPAKIT